MYELARLNGKRLPAIKADVYTEAFERAAIDLGDDGIPFRAANILLGRPGIVRWHGSNRGDEIFGYHPMNQAHRQVMTTTFAHIDEIGEIYERQLREKSS